MKRIFHALAVCMISSAALAVAPQSPNKLRHAFTPVSALSGNGSTSLSGTSDGDLVIAKLTLDEDRRVTNIEIKQAETTLRLPKSAYANLPGAQHAWLEERGELTTLVIEGKTDNKDWRLALLFHQDQIWRKRFTQEGDRRDVMTFYSRGEEMEASKPKKRKAFSQGFYND
jgi:hypothetical protein